MYQINYPEFQTPWGKPQAARTVHVNNLHEHFPELIKVFDNFPLRGVILTLADGKSISIIKQDINYPADSE